MVVWFCDAHILARAPQKCKHNFNNMTGMFARARKKHPYARAR